MTVLLTILGSPHRLPAVAKIDPASTPRENGEMSSSTAPHQPPERILLVGCGKLGIRLGSGLAADGRQVFGLRRDTVDLPDRFAHLSVDLGMPLRQPLPAVDAMVITLPPSRTSASGEDDDYLRALRNLAEALPRVPARVVLVSSTRVFEGRSDGAIITEAHAPAPMTTRGRILREGELIARDLFDAHIVRPAGIYGPGREMLVRTVLEAAPVQYARRTNRIHEADLVRILRALLDAKDAPDLLHAVDRSPAPLGDVVTHIADRLGVLPPPAIHPPVASGTVLDGARALALVGALQYPTFRAGYDHLLADRARLRAPYGDGPAH